MKKTHVKNDFGKGFFVLSSLLGAIFSLPVFAIELSQIKVHSLLNEPLEAEIDISKAKEIKIQGLAVSIADRDFYTEQGLEPLDWIHTIDIKVESDKATGKITVNLTTPEPIKDPFADLIIVATWEDGSIIKEYTLLLDPPKIAVPGTLAPQQRYKRIKPTQTEPERSKEPKEPGKVATLVKQRSTERRFDRARTRVIRPGSEYNAEEDDDASLWNIANKLVKDTPYSVTQGVAALTNKNPAAFKDGNLNTYKSKATLELPTTHDIASFTEEDAQYFIDAQNEEWEQEYIKASEASALDYVYPETVIDAELHGVKPLRLVAPELEGTSSEAFDALKRTQESILESNQLLKEQNVNLAELLAKREKEIEMLKAGISAPLEELSELNQFASSSAGEFSPYSRSNSVKMAIVWLIVGTILLFSAAISALLFRDQIQAFLTKWKNRFFKNIDPTRNTLMEAFASFAEVRKSVSFDIEKALAVLSLEEKRHVNLRQKTENQPDETTVLQEVDELIAYEKYSQAKKRLRGFLTNNPKNWEGVLKLLELYVTTESYREFETECLTLPFDLNEQAPEIWSKIEVLKNKVNSEKSISLVKDPSHKPN